MRVDPSVHTERKGVAAFATAVHGTLGWLCREQPVADFGVDAIVELVDDGHTAGRLLGAQIKSGRSFFDKETRDGWVFRFNDEHAQYWFNYDIPVVVVLHDPQSGELYWQSLSHDTAESTGKDWKVIVPAGQRIDLSSVMALKNLARPAREEGDPIEQRFSGYLSRLPGEARDWLESTRNLARETRDLGAVRAVERLAELLQAGPPSDVVTGLVKKAPAWWPHPSTVEWRLWACVGAYANEHRLEQQASACFARAVAAGATPAGRWQAFWGLTLARFDEDAARAILAEAADSVEGALLADLGLATLEHQAVGGVGPVPIPESLNHVIKDGTVPKDGTALRFLAEHARAARDFDMAVTWLEALVSTFPMSVSGRTMLAQTLAQRASDGRSPLHEADIQRARNLAETARAEQRRWGGASEDAALVLFHTHLLAGDIDAAVEVALTQPYGQANEREAAAEQLVQGAARAAVQFGHIHADRLVSKVTNPAGVAIMNAVRADVQGAEHSERIALWTQVVESAGENRLDEAVIALASLADLGVWPLPGLDNLTARSVIPADDAVLLHARADIAAGRPAAGLTRLRHLASRSLPGTMALIQSLVELGRHTEAVQACDRGASRFGATEFLLRALYILERADDHAQWRERALLLMSRSSLPRGLRDSLRRKLVQDAFVRNDWIAVEQHAVAGIADSDVPGAPGQAGMLDASTRTGPLPPELVDYAWSLIGARWNARHPDLASRAHRALGPPVLTNAQARLKAALLRRDGWSSETVEGLLDLMEQFPEDGDFTGQVLGMILVATGRPPRGDAEAESTAAFVLPPEVGVRFNTVLQAYVDRNPHGVLRPADPHELVNPDVLKAQLEPAALAYRTVRDHVMAGVVPVGVLASQVNQPYALALLQRAGGCTPAAETDPERFDNEVACVGSALDGVVVIDASTLLVATMTVAGFADLRARFASVQLPAACHDDIVMASLGVERLLASSMTIAFEPGSGLLRSTLTPEERDFLTRRADDLLQAAGLTDIVQVADLAMVTDLMTDGIDSDIVAQGPAFTMHGEGPWLAPIQLALESDATLWTDDVIVRGVASSAGIPTFGTLALLHTLYEDGLPDTTEEDHRRFVGEYVVDLPLRGDILKEQAQADGWLPRAAAIPFARPTAWLDPGETMGTFSELVRAVHERQPSEVPQWLMYGTCGFAGSGTPAEALERAVRLMCGIAAQTVGVTAAGLSELLMSATAGLRQAHALATLRFAAFAEAEVTETTEPDFLLLLRPRLIAVLMEAAFDAGGSGRHADGVKAEVEALVEAAYALAQATQQ
ncbi:hypothetical protein GCM10023194_25720 [Planotetraspora phitsanulokensis]|uniref:DUF4365 domain-containing protein n=1 Tax=Planotetraspora phitsanulokensis TaxID=575192 RepID=A0A8J3UAR1_9ACTN|nr:DUF4365 domain-containing protein [Planotetraspora phitsanulokensis]GII41919.1 hypothetical protein Pph01_69220 [Planotetraspora phitsanulokensis]